MKEILNIQKWTKNKKLTALGIIGGLFLFIGSSGLVSTTTDYNIRGDTTQHLDYTWRLYNGDIPLRSDGLTYPPIVELKGNLPQQASVNPPLFYALHALFVGPLLNEGNYKEAVFLGRALNIVLGCLAFLSIAYLGYLLGGKQKYLYAVALPVITMNFFRIARLNVDYALDGFFLIFTTLSMVIVYKLIQNGPTKKNIVLITGITSLGMLTKAPFVVFLLVNTLAVLISMYIHGKDKRKAILVSGLVFVLSVVSSFWFYYFWNYKLSGKIWSAVPDTYTGNRPAKTLIDVLMSPRTWDLFYNSFTRIVTVNIFIFCLSLSSYLMITKTQVVKFFSAKSNLWFYSLLLLATLGVFVTQLRHAVPYGSINFRYMIPVAFVPGLFVTYGLLGFKNLKGQLLVFVAFMMAFLAATTYVSGSVLSLRSYSNSVDNVGLPGIIGLIALFLLITGTCMMSYSLFKLSSIKVR